MNQFTTHIYLRSQNLLAQAIPGGSDADAPAGFERVGSLFLWIIGILALIAGARRGAAAVNGDKEDMLWNLVGVFIGVAIFTFCFWPEDVLDVFEDIWNWFNVQEAE